VTDGEYRQALDYILSFADYERMSRSAVVFDLGRMEALLDRLGRPHLAARSVHIAGTKGKGSTSAMIASVLTASGYRTGLYTSPHLHTMRERIQIDGRPVGEADFVALLKRLRPEIEAVNHQGTAGELTTFEILTALAFAHFQGRAVDYQVLETGLGGRLDATNVVVPAVCAITSISLDHTEVLGDTLAKIATEKAGIIKSTATVVSSPQSREAEEVIAEVCRRKGARLILAGREVAWRAGQSSHRGQSFRLRGLLREYDLAIPLLGEFQLDNAAVAVACLEVLAASGAQITPATIAAGLAGVHWPGRLQVLRESPLFIVDGAHNADSARKLGQALGQYFDYDRAILIVGTSKDKDMAGIAAELAGLAGEVIVTRSANPRATSPDVLAAEFSKWGPRPEMTDGVAAAVDLALAKARPGDLICATGSLFVVAEVTAYLKGVAQEEYSGH
jgi:dihydrofolate synthase/folylpolyglutamate synthase